MAQPLRQSIGDVVAPTIEKDECHSDWESKEEVDENSDSDDDESENKDEGFTLEPADIDDVDRSAEGVNRVAGMSAKATARYSAFCDNIEEIVKVWDTDSYIMAFHMLKIVQGKPDYSDSDAYD